MATNCVIAATWRACNRNNNTNNNNINNKPQRSIITHANYDMSSNVQHDVYAMLMWANTLGGQSDLLNYGIISLPSSSSSSLSWPVISLSVAMDNKLIKVNQQPVGGAHFLWEGVSLDKNATMLPRLFLSYFLQYVFFLSFMRIRPQSNCHLAVVSSCMQLTSPINCFASPFPLPFTFSVYMFAKQVYFLKCFKPLGYMALVITIWLTLTTWAFAFAIVFVFTYILTFTYSHSHSHSRIRKCFNRDEKMPKRRD